MTQVDRPNSTRGFGRFLSRWVQRRQPPANIRRVLLLKTHALGDVLMTTPAARALRQALPSARLDYLTGNWSAPALRGNPYIDEVLAAPDEALHGRWPSGLVRLIWQLRRRRYDAAVIFHPSALIHAVATLAGIPWRLGLTPCGRVNLLHRSAPWIPNSDTYAGDSFFAVAALLGAQKPRGSLVFFPSDEARCWAEQAAARATGPLVVLCPGGGTNPRDHVPVKRWPPERFAALAAALIERSCAVSKRCGVISWPISRTNCARRWRR